MGHGCVKEIPRIGQVIVFTESRQCGYVAGIYRFGPKTDPFCTRYVYVIVDLDLSDDSIHPYCVFDADDTVYECAPRFISSLSQLMFIQRQFDNYIAQKPKERTRGWN